MKRFIPILLCSLSTLSGAIFDSENCLPPVDSDEVFFPRCKEWLGNVEFLFWKVNEGNLEYAVKENKVVRAKFDSNPGVRVMAGFYNAPKYWELFGQYTYFQTYGRNRSCERNSHLKLNYQLGDVMFSRVFDPNPHLRMRLLSGISGAFIHQNWSVEKSKWKYSAGGLRVGLTADWWWKWHLYFTGRVSLAGFAGKYTTASRKLCYSDYRYAQHLQLLLGPSWHCLAKSYHTEFFIGYELNGWLNLAETYRTLPRSHHLLHSSSAVALQGLTMRATVGF